MYIRQELDIGTKQSLSPFLGIGSYLLKFINSHIAFLPDVAIYSKISFNVCSDLSGTKSNETVGTPVN